MLSLALLSLAVGGALVARWYYRDWFSPFGIFSISWFAAVALAQMRIATIQEPFTTRTWVMVLGSAVAFLAGNVAVMAAYPRPGGTGTPPAALREEIDPVRLRRAMAAILGMSLAAFAVEWARMGAVPILAPPEARTVVYRRFALPFVHYATVSSITVAVLGFLHVRVFRRVGLGSALTLAGVGTLVMIAILARQQILMIAFGALLVVNYTRRRAISGARVAVFFGIALALFVVINETRFAAASDVAESMTGADLPGPLRSLVWPYLYLALNFEVLQSLAAANLPHTFGANTLQPILSLTLTRRLFPVPNVEEEFGWFNTTTYLWPIYNDFGMWGTLIVPFWYGALAAWLYARFRARPEMGRLLVSSIGVFSTAFVFQSNSFAFTPFYVIGFEYWAALRYARRRPYAAPAPAPDAELPAPQSLQELPT